MLLKSLFLALSLLTPTLALAQSLPELKFCYGEMLGDTWDQNNKRYIKGIFEDAGFKIDFVSVPAIRGELLFRANLCDVHTGLKKANEALENHYSLIKEPVYTVNLSVFSDTNLGSQRAHQRLSLADLDNDGVNVGYMRSVNMEEYFGRLKLSKPVDLENIDQGFKMLKLGRVKYLVIPEIDIGFQDQYASIKSEFINIGSIISTQLYWWLSNKHLDTAQAIEEAIKRKRLNQKK